MQNTAMQVMPHAKCQNGLMGYVNLLHAHAFVTSKMGLILATRIWGRATRITIGITIARPHAIKALPCLVCAIHDTTPRIGHHQKHRDIMVVILVILRLMWIARHYLIYYIYADIKSAWWFRYWYFIMLNFWEICNKTLMSFSTY